MGEDFTVFVVDDNRSIRTSLKELGAAENFAVEAYASSDEFLGAYDPRRHGCLLLDVRLHGKNGLDLQDELRRRKAQLPVIVMTAYADVPTSVRAFKDGAIDFLRKPVSPEALLGHIRHLMEADQQARQATALREAVRRRIERLTPRERQVMDRIVEGLTSKQIAVDLGVSPRTVEGHRRAVLRKMRVTSAAQLVRAVMSARQPV
jgi:RNA polymerase sigma factor (sigma-70 family)